MGHNEFVPEVYSVPTDGAHPLVELPLLVVVGLTGVGKSSFARALGWPLLPNRRELVDRFVLPRMGASPHELDRTQRFQLTSRWRDAHPGGLAQLLATLHAPPVRPLVFDGLRGEEEVAYARARFPRARFVVLEAPARVRLERILGRRERFDRAKLRREEIAGFRKLAAGVIDQDELDGLLRLGYPLERLIAALKIVAEEQAHYHPEGARRALEGCSRALFLDTTAHTPEDAAARVRAWLEGWS